MWCSHPSSIHGSQQLFNNYTKLMNINVLIYERCRCSGDIYGGCTYREGLGGTYRERKEGRTHSEGVGGRM